MEAMQNVLEKSPPANSLRELVLRSLYMHIDAEDERILVAIARAMLTVSRNHKINKLQSQVIRAPDGPRCRSRKRFESRKVQIIV